MLSLILFLLLLGILLLMAEAFIPGGIVGSIGVIFMLISGFLFANDYGWALGGLYFGIGAVAGFCAWLFTFLYFAHRISLKPSSPDPKREETSPQIGAVGEVVQTLRPSGTILIGEKRYSARIEGSVSELPAGRKVSVTGSDSAYLLVEPFGEKPVELPEAAR